MKRRLLYWKSGFLSVVVVVVAVGLAGGNYSAEAASEAQFNWIMSTWGSLKHPLQPVYERMAKAIEERSAGKIKVKYYPAASFGPAKEHFDMVATGTVQLAQISTSYTPGRFPLDMVSQSGLWYGDVKKSTIMFTKQYEEVPLLKQEAEKNGVKCMLAAAIVPYYLFTNRPVKTLDDLKGMRIRCTGGQCAVIRSIGASGVSIEATEMYEAIQRKVIEGAVSDSTMGWSWRIHEAAKYVLDIPGSTLATGKFSLYIGLKAYNSLPKDLRNVIDSVSNDSISWAQEVMDKSRDSCTEQMKQAGAKFFVVPAEQRGMWRARIANGQDLLIKENESKGIPMKMATKQMVEFHKKYGIELPEYEEIVK